MTAFIKFVKKSIPIDKFFLSLTRLSDNNLVISKLQIGRHTTHFRNLLMLSELKLVACDKY